MIDVRTVLLSKVKPGNINAYKKLFDRNLIDGDSINNFVTLGNYDAIIIYDTKNFPSTLEGSSNHEKKETLDYFNDEKQALTDMYKSTSGPVDDSKAFYHPIHIIKHDVSTNIIKDFWDSKQTCFAMSFLYGTDKSTSIVELEDKISNCINLPSTNFLIYRSINLSELILVFKCNSLKSILDDIANISYTYPSLQTHTICGFRYDNSTTLLSYDNLQDDLIDMVKVTGTIRSHISANERMTKLAQSYGLPLEDKYIAYGDNDFNLIYTNVKTSKIIQTLNLWMHNHKKINEAFFSLKTRVHTKYKKNYKPADSFPFDYKAQQLINDLQVSALKCRDEQPSHTKWVYPLIETLNMLSDMYRNPELSRMRYFTLDTLFVLNRTLNDLFDNKEAVINIEDYLKENEERLIDFTTSINTLIERIVRVDGYLSQEPGFSPLIYNMIPAGILEYYCSYIYELTKYVSNFSGEKKNQYVYATLPLPQLVKYISFYDILPNQEIPNQSNQVNLLEIPYNELYHPKKLLFSVTHEVMHFCGESIRCRKARYEQLINFLTYYLIHEFDLYAIENDAKSYITNYLKSHISNQADEQYQINTSDDISLQYFITLLPKVYNAVRDLYLDTDFKNRLHILVSKSPIKDNSVDSPYWNLLWINQTCVQMQLLTVLSDIEYLFKECYADLMTINFLNLDGHEYCKLIDEMELITLDRTKEQNEVIDCSIKLRKALAIYSSSAANWDKCDIVIKHLCNIFKMCEKKEENTDNFEKQKNKLCQELQNRGYSNFDGDNSFEDHFYSPACLRTIIKYFKACSKKFDSLSLNASNKKLLNTLQEHYRIGTTSECLFSNEYCNFIYSIRKSLDDILND